MQAHTYTHIHTSSFLPVPTICYSLSSASPAHSPKEEYVITQSADTPKEETLHNQSEDQGDDASGLTEKKSVTGWCAAHWLLWSMQFIYTKKREKKLLCFFSPWISFQRLCLCVACVPPSGTMCRRKRSPGRSSWMPTRSSWRRRCRRRGGWCSAYRWGPEIKQLK